MSSNSDKRIHLSTTFAASLLVTCSLIAQDEAIELAPFTVSADGAQRTLHITERDLSQRQANDLEDALSLDPAVNVGGSTGIAQKIYVRNLGESLLNISVDGATQSGALFHHIGRIAIEPELLKQVEVQPGVGNAADGPGALGGAIRFETKDPVDLLQSGQRAGGLLRYGYYSNSDGYKASGTAFGRLNDQWSGMLSVVASEYQEIEDGAGNALPGSDTQQKVALAKLVGEFAAGHTWRFSVENLRENGDKLRRPEWAPGPANPTFPMESERTTAIAGWDFDAPQLEWLNLETHLSFSDATVMQNAVWGPYEGAIESFQLELRNTQHASGHRLVYGLDYRDDRVAAGPSEAPGSYREEASVTGFFVQDYYQASERLELSAGARFDAYRLLDQADQRFEHEGFSPNIGATYRLAEEWAMAASAASAYRGPRIGDAFRIDRSSNDPSLDAEKARNYELSVAYRRDALDFELGAYRNRIEDVITNTLPWSVVYVNAGELETDGYFARARYSADNYSLSLQYNTADTTLNGDRATRYQYGSLVSSIGNTWVFDAYWRPAQQIDIGWNTRLVEGLNQIRIAETITEVPNSSIDKPGYVTHDLYLRWTPEIAPDLTLNLTVKNLFDKLYLSHGSIENLTAFPGFAAVIGAPEPGRDIRLSASYRF